MFSTQASENDPTVLTEDEYQEIVVSDVLNTHFYKFLGEQINKCKNTVLSFTCHIKNEEPEIIKAFNESFEVHKEFNKKSTLKNKIVENYKKQRGFPLSLGENEKLLFSFDHKITYAKLMKMKSTHEIEDRQSREVKSKIDQDTFFEE